MYVPAREKETERDFWARLASMAEYAREPSAPAEQMTLRFSAARGEAGSPLGREPSLRLPAAVGIRRPGMREGARRGPVAWARAG